MKRKVYPIEMFFASATLLFIFVMSVLNAHIPFASLGGFLKREVPFSGAVLEIEKHYLEDVFFHDAFIDLNGLYARMVGKRVLNERVLLRNGMLAKSSSKRDMGKYAGEIAGLNDFLSDNGIKFLYAQLPSKIDLSGTLLPEGIESFQNENTDELLGGLAERGVNILDLRQEMSADSLQIEKYFYRTDHHWRPVGAFYAFQRISEELSEIFPERKLDLSYTDLQKWERHSLEHWFLGSHGKRVGRFFAGTDELEWYTPRFPTHMSCAILNHWDIFKGDFSDANIREKYIEKRDYFGYNPYDVYIGGDYSVVKHRNPGAPNDLKVLILKDSFVLPLQAFFSTMFRELDVVDLRHLKAYGAAEYAAANRPDIVIMAYSPTVENGKLYKNMNIASAGALLSMHGRQSLTNGKIDVRVGAKDRKRNSLTIADGKIEGGGWYALYFDDVEILKGETEGVAVGVYDNDAKEFLTCEVFDLDYEKSYGSFRWVFHLPDKARGHDLRLHLYAGLRGRTNNTGILYRGVELVRFTDK